MSTVREDAAAEAAAVGAEARPEEDDLVSKGSATSSKSMSRASSEFRRGGIMSPIRSQDSLPRMPRPSTEQQREGKAPPQAGGLVRQASRRDSKVSVRSSRMASAGSSRHRGGTSSGGRGPTRGSSRRESRRRSRGAGGGDLAERSAGKSHLSVEDLTTDGMTPAQRAHAWFKVATSAMAASELEQAIEALTKSIKIDPISHYYHTRGNCYKQRSRWEEAYFDYSEAIRLDFDNTTLYTLRATCASKMGRHKMALEDFNHACSLEPSNPNLYFHRAVLHADRGNFDAAVQDFDRCLQNDPPPDLAVKALYRRGSVNRERGNFAESRKDLEEALRLDPQSAMSYYTLSQTHKALGDLLAAEGALSEALRIENSRIIFLVERANVRLLMGSRDKLVEAVRDLTDAIHNAQSRDQKKRYAELLYLRAKARVELKDSEAQAMSLAEADAAKAVEIMPENAGYRHLLGVLCMRAGNLQGAVEQFEEVLRTSPSHIQSQFEVALCYQQLHEHQQALEMLTKVLGTVRDDHRVYEARGLLYYDMKAFHLALHDFGWALRLTPENGSLYYLRGDCHLRGGCYEQAIADFSEARLHGFPDECSLRTSRAIALRLLGNIAEALEDLEVAQQIEPQNIRVQFYKALALINLRRFERAKQFLYNALQLCEETQQGEESWIYLYHLGLCCFMRKEYDQASDHLLACLRCSNPSPHKAMEGHILLYLAHSSANLEELSVAESRFTQALATPCGRRADFRVRAVYGRAKIRQRLGDHETAIEDFSSVIEQAGDSAHVRFRRAWSYKATHQYDRAADDFETAKALEPNNPNFAVNYKHIGDVLYMELDDDVDQVEVFEPVL